MSIEVGERGDLSRWFDALRRLNQVIDNAGDIDRFAVALNNYLCETFEAQAASLILVDPRTDELVFRTAGGAPVTLLNQARLHRGEGIAGWVCKQHQSLNIPDARHDQRFCPRIDATTGFYTRSVMCVSLYRAEQIEGAIEVLNPIDGGTFDDAQLDFLEIVAEQVELLIANSTLIEGLRRRNAELTTLIDIDRAVNAVHDLDRLLQTILRSATEVSQAAGASVVLRDADSGELRFFHCVGPTQAELFEVTMEPGQGVVGHCIDNGEVIYVPDAYRDKRFYRDLDDQTGFRTTSLLCVPLITSTGVIGALEVVNLAPSEAVEELISLMEAFASQAAVALERAQLNRRLERRVDLADAQLQAINVSLTVERAKLRAMIEQMADGVIMIDDEGRLMLVNESAKELFGLGGQAVEGQAALSVNSPALAAVLAVGATGDEGVELRQDNGLTLRVHAADVAAEADRVGKVVVCSDITQLKELAQIRTELVSFVSHELRTPLTSIKGFVSAMLTDAKLNNEEHRSFIQIIDHECDRLRRMVADLLCMTRIDSGRALEMRWQRLDAGELVRHVAEAQRVYAPRHTLVIDVPDKPLVVEADQDKMEQILTNLVNNAIKYSPDGTTVTVRAAAEGDALCLLVADQGYGIEGEELDGLFQQYSRLGGATQRRIGGSGLGLYLTKHLVEAHGGTIEVASTPGKGSTFALRMPLRRPWEG